MVGSTGSRFEIEPKRPWDRPANEVLVRILWTVLTVGFEFLVGYVEGTPVSVTIGQYDVLAGGVRIAVPVALFVSPLLFGRCLAV